MIIDCRFSIIDKESSKALLREKPGVGRVFSVKQNALKGSLKLNALLPLEEGCIMQSIEYLPAELAPENPGIYYNNNLLKFPTK